MRNDTIRLLISCPDTRGIIAAVSTFIKDHSGNIVELDQHTDDSSGQFYMRVEVEEQGFSLTSDTFEAAWSPLAKRFDMNWRLAWAGRKTRVAVLVSKEGHCLHDLLFRWQAGELAADIPVVISNHRDLAPLAEQAGIEFVHCPIVNGDKAAQEMALEQTLVRAKVDLIVLARYMQVLSGEFVARYSRKIINIHHSFLPAFVGPKPYHQAFERGVKIIGATSHYVTDQLDQGPIIAQSVCDVGHRDSVQDMIRKGRDLERIVLARAVRLHVSDKILVGGNKTVVFD